MMTSLFVSSASLWIWISGVPQQPVSKPLELVVVCTPLNSKLSRQQLPTFENWKLAEKFAADRKLQFKRFENLLLILDMESFGIEAMRRKMAGLTVLRDSISDDGLIDVSKLSAEKRDGLQELMADAGEPEAFHALSQKPGFTIATLRNQRVFFGSSASTMNFSHQSSNDNMPASIPKIKWPTDEELKRSKNDIDEIQLVRGQPDKGSTYLWSGTKKKSKDRRIAIDELNKWISAISENQFREADTVYKALANSLWHGRSRIEPGTSWNDLPRGMGEEIKSILAADPRFKSSTEIEAFSRGGRILSTNLGVSIGYRTLGMGYVFELSPP